MKVPKPYSPLNDTILLQEMEWIIAQYTEKFLCNDNKVPCGSCCNKAKTIAMLFMSGYGIIGKALEEEASSIVQYIEANKNAPDGLITRAIIRVALEKMNQQKWILNQPWKKNSTPQISDGKSSIACEIDEEIDDDYGRSVTKKKSVYKLAKRKREGV